MTLKTKTFPIERDEILIPTSDGYRKYPLLVLLGLHSGILAGRSGLGMGGLRFITASSPYQHGESVQAMRWGTRVIQVLIQESLGDLARYWQQRDTLLELLRPTRSFITSDKLIDPFFYRKWIPGGNIIYGSDMATTNGSNIVYAASGAFVDRGGLGVGNAIFIEEVKYQIESVENDFELHLTVPYAGITDTGVDWHYRQLPVYREIPFILESGLKFDQPVGSRVAPHGYIEALRLRCHDPLWRGPIQTRTWALPSILSDLLFDIPRDGAWFGTVGLTGRWLYYPSYISDEISIVYRGHEISKPTIYLVGPAETPTITNLTTGVSLHLDYNVAAGEQVIIDVDRLQVVNNAGVNLLGYLRGNLSAFGLVPEPAAPGGINRMLVTFGLATTSSSARILWRNFYIGI